MRRFPKHLLTPVKTVVAALFAAILALEAGSPAAQPLRIAGSGANVGAIELLVAEFAKSHPGARFAPIQAVGTGSSIRAATAGALDFALTSRPLSDAERALGLTQIEYARTPFVIVVSSKMALDAISSAQLAEVYAGKLTRWPEGVRVRPVLRPADDGDIAILKAISPAVARSLDEALKRPGMMVAATDRDAAEMAEKTPGAIAASTLGLILTEGRAVKPLRLDGIEPSREALASGRYALQKRLFVVHAREPLPETAKRFIEFLGSAQAKALLARTGHLVPPFAAR